MHTVHGARRLSSTMFYGEIGCRQNTCRRSFCSEARKPDKEIISRIRRRNDSTRKEKQLLHLSTLVHENFRLCFLFKPIKCAYCTEHPGRNHCQRDESVEKMTIKMERAAAAGLLAQPDGAGAPPGTGGLAPPGPGWPGTVRFIFGPSELNAPSKAIESSMRSMNSNTYWLRDDGRLWSRSYS